MKKIIIVIILFLLYSSCREEHVAPINQLVKDLFCFKTGSEWVYYDSVSQTTQKMTVTNYEVLGFGGGKRAYKKIYDFAENVIMDIVIGNSKKTTNLQADGVYENWVDNTATGIVATPVGANLSIDCDENNNFTPPARYLNTYIVNEIVYSDVYVFNNVDSRIRDNVVSIDSLTYYVSKHIGFIKCVRKCNYDESKNSNLVLIDKNIQQ